MRTWIISLVLFAFSSVAMATTDALFIINETSERFAVAYKIYCTKDSKTKVVDDSVAVGKKTEEKVDLKGCNIDTEKTEHFAIIENCRVDLVKGSTEKFKCGNQSVVYFFKEHRIELFIR